MKTRTIEFTIINIYVQKKIRELEIKQKQETEKQNHNFFEAR